MENTCKMAKFQIDDTWKNKTPPLFWEIGSWKSSHDTLHKGLSVNFSHNIRICYWILISKTARRGQLKKTGPLSILEGGDVVDNLYKLKHPHSALISARRRMSICPTVLLFELTTRHIPWSVSMWSLFSASAKGAGDCRIEAWQPVPFHFYNVPLSLPWCFFATPWRATDILPFLRHACS